jgi:hypothetical protein
MGFFDSVLSIATGGLSDVVQGNTPFSGALGNSSLANIAGSILNPIGSSALGISKGLSTGDYGSALQYIVDPLTEPGIDAITRKVGDETFNAMPWLRPYASALGTTIGTAIAPGYGTLIGYEIANKALGGTGNQGVLGGAAIGATYGLGSALSSMGTPTLASDAYTSGYGKLAEGAAYQPTFYEPIVADPSLVGETVTPNLGAYGNAVANTNYFHTPIADASLTGGLLSSPTPSTTDKLLSKGKEVTYDLAKKFGKQALMSGLMGQPQQYNPIQAPNPIPNYSQIPVSQKPVLDPQKATEMPESNVKFSNAELNTEEYLSPEDKKKKEEEKKKQLNEYVFNNKNYLGQYFS